MTDLTITKEIEQKRKNHAEFDEFIRSHPTSFGETAIAFYIDVLGYTAKELEAVFGRDYHGMITQYKRFKTKTAPKKTLKQITGQESGVIIFNADGAAQAIVCHWESVNNGHGVPRIGPAGSLISLAEELEMLSEGEVENVVEALGEANIIYTDLEDLTELDTAGYIYTIETNAGEQFVVIAPEGWN